MGAMFKHGNAAFNGEQEKESIGGVGMGKKSQSLGITIVITRQAS